MAEKTEEQIRLLALMLAALLAVGAAHAQGYSYEVSAVRPNTTGSGNSSVNNNDGAYVSLNQGLRDIIEDCFNLQIDGQIIGLPAWAASAHYDIKAKLDAETATRLKALKGEEQNKAEDELIQHLLEDRFKLKFHHETRELPEYALVQSKTGNTLKAADPASSKAGNMSWYVKDNSQKMEAYSAEMVRLVTLLCNQVHRPVVDKTGLTGKYDMKLEWTREDMINSTADGTSDRAPGLMTALQEQLGLKLESTKGTVDVIVIDHIEQPTEN